jgi:DNA-binding transcriptional LysR family regulator
MCAFMHLHDLDLTQIRLLAELARLGSVSAAARRIGLSQSAASHALAKLRLQLGDPLFMRTSAGFKPTPFGERLGRAAVEALDRLAEGLASNHSFDPKTSRKQFTFYMSDVGQMVLLPGLLSVVHREAPGVLLRSAPIPLDDPAATLISGEVDLAIGFFTNLRAGFHQTVVFNERYVCVVRADHPAFSQGMTLEAFREARHAIADSTGMAHALIDDHLARHRVSRRDGLRVPGFHVLPLIIASTDLVAIIPGRLADAVATHLPIKVFDPPVPLPPYDIRMFWHERFHNDPASRWMRRQIVEVLHVSGEHRRHGGLQVEADD